MSYRLAEIAERLQVDLVGDGECVVDHVDTLQDAGPGAICFLANSKYRRQLHDTRASAVILSVEHAGECPVNALVCQNPYLIYARVSLLLNPAKPDPRGIHPTAVVADSASVDKESWIGPHAVIEEDVVISAGVFVGPGSIVGAGCSIGQDSRLLARVTLCHGTQIGSRVVIHPGAVIGSDGFGNANDNGVWEKVPQLGRAIIGDDVEIGSNTTIDRGSLRDTVIESGVRLDNQIQIAHNVSIGAHTAIAGCVGIAGSTSVGRHCTVGGGVGISGHLEIGDNVHITGQALVTRSFKEAGVYSGNLPAVTNSEWRKSIARLRRLGDIMERLKELERGAKSQTDGNESDKD